jgi:hypothetical protein
MGRAKSKQRVAKKPRTPTFDPKPSHVLVSDRQGVNQYLKAHPLLGRRVNDLCELARQAFGCDAELALNVYRDPEIDDQYLTLYVRLEEYKPDVVDRIESMRQGHGESQKGTNGHILVTTDFRRPGRMHGV